MSANQTLPSRPALPSPPRIASVVLKDAFRTPANDVEIISAIANALQKPPPLLDDAFIDGALWVAGFLRVAVSNTPPASNQSRQLLVMQGRIQPLSASRPRSQTREAQCSQALANTKFIVERVCDFAPRARNAGFEPPENPFAVIAQINGDRGDAIGSVNISVDYASALVFNIKVHIDLLDAENQGGINFDSQQPINKAQLGNITLSFNGLGGSGNVAADILTFLPSSDQVRQNIAAQELAVLDFTRRVPYLLFTLDYESKGKRGVIVGWKKIADASGFIVKRHASFSQTDTQVNIDNVRIKSDTLLYLDYAKLHALTYLEDFDDSAIQLYFDDSLLEDEYYVYTLQAFQYRSEMKGALFSGTSKAVPYTAWTFSQIDSVIEKMDPDMRQIVGWEDYKTPVYKVFPTTISPWPAYAQYLATDSMYDWILAAVNIRASINRGDDRTLTRKFSYLSAQHEFLTSMSQTGKLVTPDDLAGIVKGIENSISQFGVAQTILEIFQETGITYHFDGLDPRSNGPFGQTDQATSSTSLFHVIGSAIDPDTATIDLKAVAHNMSQLATKPGTSLTLGTNVGTPGARSQPSELAVPDPDKQTDQTAEDPYQFIARLGKMDDSIVDLTTFDGISKLVRVIRIYSDFGPDRVKSTHIDSPPPPAPPAPRPPSATEILPPSSAPSPSPVVKTPTDTGSPQPRIRDTPKVKVR